jgi:putative FmdB family regulatory protein
LPLYPYRCTVCGHHFEKIQSFSAEPETECPKCHGVLERPLTAPGLQFKGAGWYVNDYASKSSASSSSSSAPKVETPCGGSCGAACPAAAAAKAD